MQRINQLPFYRSLQPQPIRQPRFSANDEGQHPLVIKRDRLVKQQNKLTRIGMGITSLMLLGLGGGVYKMVDLQDKDKHLSQIHTVDRDYQSDAERNKYESPNDDRFVIKHWTESMAKIQEEVAAYTGSKALKTDFKTAYQNDPAVIDHARKMLQEIEAKKQKAKPSEHFQEWFKQNYVNTESKKVDEKTTQQAFQAIEEFNQDVSTRETQNDITFKFLVANMILSFLFVGIVPPINMELSSKIKKLNGKLAQQGLK